MSRTWRPRRACSTKHCVECAFASTFPRRSAFSDRAKTAQPPKRRRTILALFETHTHRLRLLPEQAMFFRSSSIGFMFTGRRSIPEFNLGLRPRHALTCPSCCMSAVWRGDSSRQQLDSLFLLFPPSTAKRLQWLQLQTYLCSVHE